MATPTNNEALEKFIETLNATPARTLIEQTIEKLQDLYLQKRIEKIKAAGSEEKLADDLEFSHEKLFDGDWLPTSASPDTYPRHSEKYRDLVTAKGTETFNFREMMVLRMLVVRKMDVDSAADRLLNLRGLVLRYKLSFVLDDDIRTGISLNAFSCFPPKLEGGPREGHDPRVCIFILPRNIDWTKITVHQMQKAWFFSMMTAQCSSFSAQTEGLVIQNSLKDIGRANVCMEFQRFLGAAVVHCMPSRLSRAFIANQPFFFGHIMWPLMKNVLSKKIRERISVISTDYKLVHEEMGGKIGSIHSEMNGGYSFNDPDSLRRAQHFAEDMHVANYEQKKTETVAE